jgi:hypothetical protein
MENQRQWQTGPRCEANPLATAPTAQLSVRSCLFPRETKQNTAQPWGDLSTQILQRHPSTRFCLRISRPQTRFYCARLRTYAVAEWLPATKRSQFRSLPQQLTNVFTNQSPQHKQCHTFFSFFKKLRQCAIAICTPVLSLIVHLAITSEKIRLTIPRHSDNF